MAFERADIRYPYVLGQLWNNVDRPPENDAANNNDLRIIRSRKGHVIVFDDGDKGSIRIELSDGKRIHIDDDGVVIDDNTNQLALRSSTGSVTVEAAQTLTLKAPLISLEASRSLELHGGASLNAMAALVRIN